MPSDTPAPPEAAADIELLCAWIEARMAYRGEPGLSIAIVHDQELVCVMIRNGELVMLDPTADEPLATLATLTPVAEHVFRYESADGSGPVGELAVFELDAAGTVRRLKYGENYTYPVAAWD